MLALKKVTNEKLTRRKKEAIKYINIISKQILALT